MKLFEGIHEITEINFSFWLNFQISLYFELEILETNPI
jgi:hypothetical protein